MTENSECLVRPDQLHKEQLVAGKILKRFQSEGKGITLADFAKWLGQFEGKALGKKSVFCLDLVANVICERVADIEFDKELGYLYENLKVEGENTGEFYGDRSDVIAQYIDDGYITYFESKINTIRVYRIVDDIKMIFG